MIWSWYGYKSSDTAQTTILCKICHHVVIAKGGNTNNLFHHPKSMHVHDYEDATRAKSSSVSSGSCISRARPKTTQQSFQALFTAGVPYGKTSTKWKDITKAVAQHIAMDMVPIRIVLRDGFKNLFCVLDQRYELPGQKYLSQADCQNCTWSVGKKY